MCLFTSTSVFINDGIATAIKFYLQIRLRPKAEGWWGESSVSSVKAGINREASFRDKMPKNHDNVNIPELRCHVVHFLWQIQGGTFGGSADLISCCTVPVGCRDTDWSSVRASDSLPSANLVLNQFIQEARQTESHLTSGGVTVAYVCTFCSEWMDRVQSKPN